MAFEDLFIVYPNKNAELRMLSHKAWEYGRNAAKEQSAAMSIGVNEHAIKRNRRYVQDFRDRLTSIHARPVPDLPYTHPVRLDIDLTAPYRQFTKDGEPINEDTRLLAEYWMFIAVSVAKSQSAGMAGSMIDADYERLVEQCNVIDKFLDEVEKRPIPDIPETSFPAAMLEVPGGTGTGKKY